jgi:threonine dehydrogenase-like Zn-dependent dehydrogenase
MDLYPGAYAEYCVAWEDLVFPVPDHVSSDAAAMMDIFCVAVHAAARVRDLAGARVLCIGGGPAGAAIAQVARSRQAAEVMISEPSPVARRILSALGFDKIVDPAVEDVRASVGSAGFVDVIFDTVGASDTVETSLDLLAPAGSYVVVAVHDAAFHANLQHLGTERILTSSSNATYEDVREAFRLICSGAVSADAMISHRFPLHDYQAAYDLLLAEPKQGYKVILTPDGNALASGRRSETAA